MAKYLLPCECGQGVPVDASQAGQLVTCPCGKQLEVPTLRGIRELAPAEGIDDSVPRESDWGPIRGAVFVVSLVSLLVGMGLAAYGYQQMIKVADVSRDQEQQIFARAIDQTTPTELFTAWQRMREEGLGPKDNNPFVSARRDRRRMKTLLIVGVVIGVAGLFGTIGPLLLRGKSPGV